MSSSSRRDDEPRSASTEESQLLLQQAERPKVPHSTTCLASPFSKLLLFVSSACFLVFWSQTTTFEKIRSNRVIDDDDDGPFPVDFVWGVATSAYQIEGAVMEDGRGETIWDTFVRIPDAVLDNSTGDVADDHYHRWKEDVALMKSLNVTAYRFSIAWSRILPTGRGAVNEAGIQFYDRLVDELLANSIEPWITLFHWDLPQALQDDFGGWLDPRTVDAFTEYASVVFQRYAPKVKRFITLNEPWT